MTTETLPPCTVLVSLNEKRHTQTLEGTVTGLCAELERVQAERDALKARVEALEAQLGADPQFST